MSKTSKAQSERRPILFIGIGRQRVGKTTFLNTVIQAVREQGANLVIWNADLLNVTYNLPLFHDDVLEPPSADFDDVKSWLEERIQDQIDGQYNAFLDVGGGDTPLSRLVREIPIVQTLERQGIRVVLAHVIGPEQADVDYLRHFTAQELFAPEATMIVLNAGLVMSGRSASNAFASIKSHPIVTDALAHGAKLVMMPPLSCMSQVTDRGLTFSDAAEGVVKGEHARLSFFDQERVSIWWTKAVPAFIDSIPPLWLPASRRTVSMENSAIGPKANAEEQSHA
ncbi:hypothetical protein [Acidisphaera sp. L21]|uniref:hypothetical protein n=1 Tax=Acidisphaera sp. L21 TaxID=1641851 RepID=UPI00131D56D6|nr:hypothetical protein [Acidisphaera sp. L21]